MMTQHVRNRAEENEVKEGSYPKEIDREIGKLFGQFMIGHERVYHPCPEQGCYKKDREEQDGEQW